ncbi:hypothetical protein PC117_g24630 [Phytophthora cactorum]|uniref:Uncharacterized protein n=1 Tax=Phytophthora cactorum TaxID=29920 RepID=A0A8T1AXA8_9STRA|nr:hypothetical protein PC117_g24630 [Phytophthora cactorum]
MRPGSGPRIPTYTVRVVQQVQEERVKQQIDISPPPAQDRKQSSDDPMPAFVSTNPSQAASQMIMVHHRVEEQLLCDREVWVIFQKVEREWVSGIVQNSPRVCGKQRGPVIRSSRYPVIGRGAAARGVRRGKSHPRGNRGRRSQSSHNQGRELVLAQAMISGSRGVRGDTGGALGGGGVPGGVPAGAGDRCGEAGDLEGNLGGGDPAVIVEVKKEESPAKIRPENPRGSDHLGWGSDDPRCWPSP